MERVKEVNGKSERSERGWVDGGETVLNLVYEHNGSRSYHCTFLEHPLGKNG